MGTLRRLLLFWIRKNARDTTWSPVADVLGVTQ